MNDDMYESRTSMNKVERWLQLSLGSTTFSPSEQLDSTFQDGYFIPTLPDTDSERGETMSSFKGHAAMAFQAAPKPLNPLTGTLDTPRASSLPPPSHASPMRKRSNIDMNSIANLLPALYPDPTLTAQHGPRPGHALAHTSSFVSDEDASTDSSTETQPSTSRAHLSHSPTSFCQYSAVDHPLSPAEQLEVMDRVRKDLIGIDSSKLKGPLRALAAQNEHPSSNRPFSRPSQPQGHDAKPKSQPQMEQMTVSPQEAFLDYDDVATRSQTQQRNANNSNMFAPLRSVYASGSDEAVIDQAMQQIKASNDASLQDKDVDNEPQSARSGKSYRFDVPKHAVRWGGSDRNIRIRHTSSNDDYPVDDFSISEDEPSPPTPPLVQYPPGTLELPVKSKPPTIDPTMPLLSRAAEESYFSQRGSMPPDDSSESASQDASPRDFYSSSSASSFSEGSRSSSSSANNSTHNSQIWLSGPPPGRSNFPEPAISLDGRIRNVYEEPAQISASNNHKQATTTGQVPFEPEPVDEVSQAHGQREESAERSTLGDDDLPATRFHSSTPKRKRMPQTHAARVGSSASSARTTPRPRTGRTATPQVKEEVSLDSPATTTSRESRAPSVADDDSESDEYQPDDASGSVQPAQKKRRRDTSGTPDSVSGGHATTSAARAGGIKTSSGGVKCDWIDPDTGKRCNTVFRRPYDLARHKDTIHVAPTSKPKWLCATCDHEFSRKDALQRHVRLRGHRAAAQQSQ